MSRPTWTVAGAARATGVARSTIQRALRDDRLPGAIQGSNGWEIPTEALLEAGFSLQHQGMPEQERATVSRDSSTSAPLQPSDVQRLKDEVTSLQAALQLAHAREAAARAVADERERTIEAQGLALRALTSGRSDSEHREEAPAPEPPKPSEPPMSAAPPTNQRGRFRRFLNRF